MTTSCVLLELTSDIVELYPKAIVHHQTISSKLATRMKKRNNNTLLYTDPEVSGIQYGRVEAFVVLPQESLQLAVVQPLTVCSYAEVKHLHIPEEMANQASLCFTDFVTLTGDCQPRVAIPIEHIVTKCFDITTTGFSGLTTLVNEKEVSL